VDTTAPSTSCLSGLVCSRAVALLSFLDVAPFFSSPNKSQAAYEGIRVGKLSLYDHLAGFVDEAPFAIDSYGGQPLRKLSSLLALERYDSLAGERTLLNENESTGGRLYAVSIRRDQGFRALPFRGAIKNESLRWDSVRNIARCFPLFSRPVS
jgi:hypothetical protein